MAQDSAVASDERQLDTKSQSVDLEIDCPKCGALRVAESRPQMSDAIVLRLFAKAPYRCLRCYHRFWLQEPLFSRRERIATWAMIGIVFLAITLWFGVVKTNEQSSASDIAPVEKDTSTDNVFVSQIKPLAPETLVDTENFVDTENNKSDLTPVAAVEPSSTFNLSVDGPKQIEVGDGAIVNPIDSVAAPSLSVPSPQDVDSAEQAALQAEQSSQSYQAALDDALSANFDELRSLAKIEINYHIEQWRLAWATGKIQDYLDAYANDFVPEEQRSRSSWEAQRRDRVSPGRKVDIEMRDFDITFEPGLEKASIEFEQDYQSGSYTDLVRKQLVVVKRGQSWKIIRERQFAPQDN